MANQFQRHNNYSYTKQWRELLRQLPIEKMRAQWVAYGEKHRCSRPPPPPPASPAARDLLGERCCDAGRHAQASTKAALVAFWNFLQVPRSLFSHDARLLGALFLAARPSLALTLTSRISSLHCSVCEKGAHLGLRTCQLTVMWDPFQVSSDWAEAQTGLPLQLVHRAMSYESLRDLDIAHVRVRR